MSEVKHDPLQITGKVKPSSSGTITHFRLRGIGFKTYQEVVKLIEDGYDVQYKKGGDLSTFTVKDTVQNDGTVKKSIVSVRDETELNNITEIPEVKLTEAD